MAGVFQRTFGGMRLSRISLNLGKDKSEFCQEFWAEGEHLRLMAHTEDDARSAPQNYYRLVDGRSNGDGRIAIFDKNVIPIGFAVPDSDKTYLVRYNGELRMITQASLDAAGSGVVVPISSGATQTQKIGWLDLNAWINAIDATQAGNNPAGLAENITVGITGKNPAEPYPVGANGAPKVKNEVVFSYTVSKKLADNYWAETPPAALPHGSVAFAPGNELRVSNLVIPAEGADRLTIYASIGLNTRVWHVKEGGLAANGTYTFTGPMFGKWLTGAEQTTQAYDPVPDNLVEAAILPNNIVAVAQKHRIFLSLPGIPHAYPVERTLYCEDEIRRIIPDQTGGVVLTDKAVYRINGDRLTLLADHMPLPANCLSAVASTGTGVYFPCLEGWVHIYGNRVRLLTEEREGGGNTIIPRNYWQIFTGNGIACACVLGRHLAYLQWNDFEKTAAQWVFLDLQMGDLLFGRNLSTSPEFQEIDRDVNHPAGLAYEKGYWHYRFAGKRRFLEDYAAYHALPKAVGATSFTRYMPEGRWRSGRLYQIGDTVPKVVRVSARTYPVTIGIRSDDYAKYPGSLGQGDPSPNDDFLFVTVPDERPILLPTLSRGTWWQYEVRASGDVYGVEFAETADGLTVNG